MPSIGADELKQLSESGKNFVFVDVRSASEIEQGGTLPNYTHIPIGQFEQRMSEIPRGKKVVVACEVGARAARGASLLLKQGYKDVYSAGLREYRNKGYSLIYPKLSSPN